ncbi:MAG TPA: ABC transporter permease [Vicinamibacterales bacterium]|nr:ABC transporter permease [Vicinamibacterales bacterium]
MSQDLRYALRLLVHSPGFFLVAILTLALGIGANTAIFSVVHALLLRPLPYPEADRLVMVWQDLSEGGGRSDEWATPGNYFDWRNARDLFAGVTAVQGWQPTLTGLGSPEPLTGEQVTSDYFDVLRIQPAIGRGFRSDDMVPKAPRVAVLSHALWQRRFGGNPAVLGTTVMLGGEPHEIVGVMAAGFRPAVIAVSELWRPRQLDAANPARGAVILRVVARLQDGLPYGQAQSAATLLARQLEQAHPDFNAGIGIRVVPLQDQVVGGYRLALLVLLGAVAFVLLIACVNIANLLLARASARNREMAVRLALGASRPRVIRQLLTESVLLAAVGGAVGLLVGAWGIAGLTAIAPAGAPRVNEIGLDWTVLAFSAALTLITGIAFGLIPAVQASRPRAVSSLRDGTRSDAGASGRRARRTLIVVEVGLALVLLVGSGLLMRTLVRLQGVELGFEPAGVLVGAVLPPQVKYPTGAARIAFYDRVLERVSALPGVEKAAISSVVPLGGGDNDMDVHVEGRPVPRTPVEATTTWYRLVSAGYFDAMGIGLRSGRGIAPREAEPVVVVGETAARRYWPGEDPLGRRVRFGTSPDAPWFTVVGVADDVRMAGAREGTRVEMYLPYWHFPEAGTNVVLKTGGDPIRLAEAVRQAVREIDPDMPVSGITPMDALVARSIAQSRFIALLSAAFAGLALSLSAIGIYGVTSYTVALRTGEIGVRMALGADRGDVFRLVVGEGLKLAALGSLIGLGAALALSRSMATLLFGIAPYDPVTFAATTAVLLAVALLAGALPAGRATRVDPAVALRAE